MQNILTEQLVDPDSCRAIATRIAASSLWQPARVWTPTGSCVRTTYRQQDVIQVADTDLGLQAFAEWFKSEASRAWGRPHGRPVVFQYQRTTPGGHFTWHRDGTTTRPVSCVWMLYLSGGLEGGETEFGDGTLVAPKPGTAVMFDGQLRHRGREVRGGTKYTLTAAMGAA